MALVPTVIRVVTDDAIPVPVDNVLVQIFSSDGTTFITSGLTGNVTPTSGELEISLDGSAGGTTYVLRPALDGYSFLPTTEFQFNVFDPPAAPPNDNVIELETQVGAQGVPVLFAVEDDEAIPNPIEGVLIRLFDAGDSFITSFLTDSSGEAELYLEGVADPGTTYIVRLLKAGYIFDEPTQFVAVKDPLPAMETNEFEFVAAATTLPQATDPEMCRVSGFITDVGLRPRGGIYLRFMPKMLERFICTGFPYPATPSIVNRSITLYEAKFPVNNDGTVEFDLPRGGLYEVHIYGYEVPNYTRVVEMVVIPDAPAVKLEDLLFPYVESVTFDPVSVSGSAGTDTTAEVTVTDVLGLDRSTASELSTLLEFTSADEDVATVEVTADGVVTIRFLQAGSTQVDVARKEGTVAPQRPDLVALAYTPLTVTTT